MGTKKQTYKVCAIKSEQASQPGSVVVTALQSQLPGKLRLEDSLSHRIGDLTRQLRLLFFRGEGT